MTLLIRLVPNSRCVQCGALGRTDLRTMLCLSCLHLKILVSDRKQKLSSTLETRWAYLDAISLDTGAPMPASRLQLLQAIGEKLKLFEHEPSSN